MRVGFLGTGHIAAPMARALAKDGHSITVSERNAEVSAVLAVEIGALVADNQGVLDASDIVFLTLRPGVWAEAVRGLEWRDAHQIVSAMAGVSIAEIAAACGPVTDIFVILPLGHIEHGGCPLPVTPAGGPVEALFGKKNPVIPVADEGQMAAHFAASTVLTALLSSMIAATDWLADETGSPENAEAYITHLASSYLSALPASLEETRSGLTYKKTLNRAMLDALTDIGFEPTVTATMDGMAQAMRSGG